ncbi:GAF domain-containing sensor histidine kinase [Halovenus marina]|uniref:GAF domain-containing sensor histidine kinase n=1 Tax=Halovenus marina TaxID=3396621 RepID=UPI003F56C659
MDPARSRERLYEVFADPDSDPKKKIQQALEIGRGFLKLPLGFYTQIQQGTQEIVLSAGDHPLIQPGERCPLDEAYCRRTVQIDSVLAIEDADASAAISNTAIERFDLGTYIGAKVTVNDEPHGTVCFAADEERETVFTDTEIHFVELFAQLLGQTIERHIYERELKDQQEQLRTRNQLISVLNRVLRHNLRNDMNVISGLASILVNEIDGQEADYARQIVETSDGLLDITETANKLEANLNTPSEPQLMDIVPVVTRVANAVDDAHPAVSVCIAAPETAMAWADSRLELALRELVENAAKHAGGSPSVRIDVTESDTSTKIHVRDDGPGLPEQERQVLLTGKETPLVHGSGLGLWLVHSLVQSIDGTLEIGETDDGACIVLELHRGKRMVGDANNDILADRR